MAVRHLEFVCHLYKFQLEAGRFFLHEHPHQADSWDELCVRKLLSSFGVEKIEMDQCQMGQKDKEGNPIRKPTRWMSNFAMPGR